jgi:CheY-like chemotaxis protein
MQRLPGVGPANSIDVPTMEPLTDSLSPTSPTLLANRVIVVIDDDEALRSLMGSYLRRAGATVHQAANGRDALTLMEGLHASATPVHAVLCDLRMRGGSGMELHRRVGEILPSMAPRMIFSSGDIDSGDVREFIEQSGVKVLTKPFALAELRRLLAELPPAS